MEQVRDLKALSAILITITLAGPAGAAELQVVCPPLVREGLKEFASGYLQKTGRAVVVRSDVMGKILDDIETGTPVADVVLLPPNLMDILVKNRGVEPGTRMPVGRVEIGLAVRPGAPHPDISTVEKLRAALLGAKAVAYTQPGPPRNSMEAGIIDRMLHRPEFMGIHTTTVTTGSGISALAKGNSDLALQVVPEINATPGTELVGPLPPELGAHIDVEVAISARSIDPEGSEAFIRYITQAEATRLWGKFGLNR
jgi:molybdate transport system substrate-binding protein